MQLFSRAAASWLLLLTSLTSTVETAHAAKPIVLIDSFHAHNFIDRGLAPDEHNYHRLTGLRRAMGMLTDRQVELRELVVGPITAEKLQDVQLIILNLPSMDRPPWLTSEIDAVDKFIRGGGGMIFITDHSNCYYHQYHLLPLWQRLGLTPTFETTCEQVEKNKLAQSGPGWLLIRDFDQHPVTENVRFFAMQTGGRVVGEGTIARTSPQAWADHGLAPLYGEGNPGLLGDLRYTDSEESGAAQGVVQARTIERGRVVILADQNAFGDAQISYADNWRLWLNACSWTGRLQIPTTALTIDQIAIARRSTGTSPSNASDLPAFDQIVGRESDRNAQPKLPNGTWHIECWEPLTKGTFRWGGTDERQLYYFWCWLNRWCWTSAHERPSNPAPQGRVMLIAHRADRDDEGLKQRMAEVMRQQGKIVWLNEPAIRASSEASTETNETIAQVQSEVLGLLPEDVAQKLSGLGTWHDQPIKHVQFQDGQAKIFVIVDIEALQNAHFLAPEVAPNAAQTKWQRQLYHWLFEQP